MTNNIKELLINAIREEPAIWDKRNKNHHNVPFLLKKWKRIGEELQVPDKTLKGMWKNLRQEFGKQLRKTYAGGYGTAEEVSSWPYFTSLLFLEDQFAPLKSLSILPDDADEEDVDEASVSSHPSLVVETSRSTDRPINEPSSSSAATASDFQAADNATGTGHRRRALPQCTIVEALLAVEKERLELKKSRLTFDPNDEDVGFFNSILPHVKKFDDRSKMIFRMRVQQLVYDLSYSSSPPPPPQDVKCEIENFSDC